MFPLLRVFQHSLIVTDHRRPNAKLRWTEDNSRQVGPMFAIDLYRILRFTRVTAPICAHRVIGTALPVPNSFPPSVPTPCSVRLPAQIPPRLAQNNPPSWRTIVPAEVQITPGKSRLERDSGPCRVFTRKLTPLPPPLPHTVSSPPFNFIEIAYFIVNFGATEE